MQRKADCIVSTVFYLLSLAFFLIVQLSVVGGTGISGTVLGYHYPAAAGSPLPGDPERHSRRPLGKTLKKGGHRQAGLIRSHNPFPIDCRRPQ